MRNEKGIYTVFTAITLVMLMFVLGLAIDSGRLELDRTRLQLASDAGAVVSGSRIGDMSKADVEKLGRLVAQDNMKANRLFFDSNNVGNYITAVMTTNNDVEVTSKTVSETFFIGKVVSGKPSWNLSAPAAAKKRPVAVTLVLDVSRSMNEKASSTCTRNCQTKLSALKSAAKVFVNSFDEAKDALSLVVYSDTATVKYTLAKPFSKTQLSNVIENLQVDNRTNIHAGMISARQQFVNMPTVVGAGYEAYQKVIVLITDGAPNLNAGTKLPAGCNPVSGAENIVLPVIEADLARADNILVFGIAIGTTDTNLTNYYQTLNNSSLIKTVMFHRLVNAFGDAGSDPAFPTSCVPAFKDIASKPVGRYLQSAEGQDISYMLNEVSLEIQMKLTK